MLPILSLIFTSHFEQHGFMIQKANSHQKVELNNSEENDLIPDERIHLKRTAFALVIMSSLFVTISLFFGFKTTGISASPFTSDAENLFAFSLIPNLLNVSITEEIHMEVAWQPPPLISPENWRGVVFLFHGCSHSATDFWPNSTACRACLGLPEETSILRHILKKGYVAVAISSLNRHTMCWSSHDIMPAATAIKVIMHLPEINYRAKEMPWPLPIFGLGISSGGGFVQFLARQTKEVNFAAISSMISNVLDDSFELVPTLFVFMESDTSIPNTIPKHFSRSNPAGFRIINLPMLQITPFYFYERSDLAHKITKRISVMLFEALKTSDFLTNENYLTEDPRKSDWRPLLKPFAPTDDTLVADESTIAQLLNVAYGLHETSAQPIMEILNWFDIYKCVWNIELDKLTFNQQDKLPKISDFITSFAIMSKAPPDECRSTEN